MPENTVNKRKTFAIISHPDAGKTTLTEKLLLFGGAIQQAGAVKARGENRRAHSDWMKVEQERGISVASSVMTFEYHNITFNLLDTPGHEDFSEDTYRVLTAVDSAVMVIDSAKGIETQTKNCLKSVVSGTFRLLRSSIKWTARGKTRSCCWTTLKNAGARRLPGKLAHRQRQRLSRLLRPFERSAYFDEQNRQQGTGQQRD